MENRNDHEKPYDVVIIGGGTGAMGAAYALKNYNYSVAVIEQEPRLGGTACNSWVETWVEGVIPPYLEKICKELHIEGWEEAFLSAHYTKTQKAHGLFLQRDLLSHKYQEDLKDKMDLFTGHKFISVLKKEEKESRIKCISIVVKQGDTEKVITGKYFIDASADGVLCRALGEEHYSGRDSRSMYGESIAPIDNKFYKEFLNEPSLFFEIKNGYDDSKLLSRCTTVYAEYNPDGSIQKIVKPDYITLDGYWGGSFVNPMTGMGGGTVGSLVIREGVEASYKEFEKRIVEYWKYLKLSLTQAKEQGKARLGAWGTGFLSWGYTGIHAPYLGIRETFRIRCKYMLRQNDLIQLISSRKLYDYIACGSHTVDFHIVNGLDTKQLNAINQKQEDGMPSIRPYGIPYRCLIPYHIENVLIASRCMGASQIALASARINMVMAQIGWAAGNAVRMCLDHHLKSVNEVNVPELQSERYTAFEARIEMIESKYNHTLKSELQRQA